MRQESRKNVNINDLVGAFLTFLVRGEFMILPVGSPSARRAPSAVVFFANVLLACVLFPSRLQSSPKDKPSALPWMNSSLSPDERAAMVLKEMTIDEKITLLHGTGMQGLSPMSPLAIHSNGGAGYVPGIPRLGIPAIQMSDAAYGVRSSGENGRYSTALPADVAGGAGWGFQAGFEERGGQRARWAAP